MAKIGYMCVVMICSLGYVDSNGKNNKKVICSPGYVSSNGGHNIFLL